MADNIEYLAKKVASSSSNYRRARLHLKNAEDKRTVCESLYLEARAAFLKEIDAIDSDEFSESEDVECDLTSSVEAG